MNTDPKVSPDPSFVSAAAALPTGPQVTEADKDVARFVLNAEPASSSWAELNKIEQVCAEYVASHRQTSVAAAMARIDAYITDKLSDPRNDGSYELHLDAEEFQRLNELLKSYRSAVPEVKQAAGEE